MQFHKCYFDPADELLICSPYRSYKRQLHHCRKPQSRARHVDPAERILRRPCPPLCRVPFASGCLTPIDRRPDQRPKVSVGCHSCLGLAAEEQTKPMIGRGIFSCEGILRIPDLVTHLGVKRQETQSWTCSCFSGLTPD